MCDTCRPASSALIPQYQPCHVPAGVCRERGVGEQSLCMSLLGEVPFRGLSETWLQLQLCSSNTVLFFTFDLNSTGCFWGAVSSPVPPAALPGACRDHPLPWQRAGKGLELLCSPPSSLLARRDGGLLLPARHCWHLPSLGAIPGGMESTCISQKGPRRVSLSHPELGPSGPIAASIRALTCRELPASEQYY